MEEDVQKRGVENARIVDLIQPDADSNQVVLTMVESRPWKTTTEQLNQIESKFNAYLGYVLDGHLVRQYPQYEGWRVKFVCICAYPLGEEESEFFQAASHYAQTQNLTFELKVIPEEERDAFLVDFKSNQVVQ